MSQSKTPITDERQLQCESLSDQAWGFEGWTLAGQHEIKIALLKNTLLNDRDAARAEGIEMEDKLTAVTEQRDRLAEALQKLADCDWVITPHDRMDAVRNIAREALQSLTPKDK
jgi:hypothetical protein